MNNGIFLVLVVVEEVVVIDRVVVDVVVSATRYDITKATTATISSDTIVILTTMPLILPTLAAWSQWTLTPMRTKETRLVSAIVLMGLNLSFFHSPRMFMKRDIN